MDKNYKSFDEFINTMVEYYKRQDLHINNDDNQSDVRLKDMNFGKSIAYEDVLNRWNYYKNKQ